MEIRRLLDQETLEKIVIAEMDEILMDPLAPEAAQLAAMVIREYHTPPQELSE